MNAVTMIALLIGTCSGMMLNYFCGLPETYRIRFKRTNLIMNQEHSNTVNERIIFNELLLINKKEDLFVFICTIC